MVPNAPYLSLVATARNDDHGGNLMGRMQLFVSGWIEQARRHNIASELILVEWNPLPDRAPLADALKWPESFGPCHVRIITVPNELHRRYLHGDALPVYQMIGKNVGIRRAKGQFVLATNIDILFNSELAARFASRDLAEEILYRADRYDTQSDPPQTTLDDQLRYCSTNLIRINGRLGTFAVGPDGSRQPQRDDIPGLDTGILPDDGWCLPESSPFGERFRWATEISEIQLQVSPADRSLYLDLEPGPWAGGAPIEVSATDDRGKSLATLSVGRRTAYQIPVPSGCATVRLACSGAGVRLGRDPRPLCLATYRIECRASGSSLPSFQPPSILSRGWAALQHVIRRMAIEPSPVTFHVPVPAILKGVLYPYVAQGGLTGVLSKILGRPAQVKLPPATEAVQAMPPPFLHTNACGDFTMLSRKRWHDLRGYAEFDMYSMNLDSLLLFCAAAAGAKEETFAEPMRIYHIEHGSGSGWTPEGEAKLRARLAEKNVGWLENDRVLAWAAQMASAGYPFVFNDDNWGLGDCELKETVLTGGTPDGRPR